MSATMLRRVLILAGLASAMAGSVRVTCAEETRSTTMVIGERVRNPRSLRDVRGNRRSLYGFEGHRGFVLAFVGIDCPLANLYIPRLTQLEKRYRPRGVQFLAIYPNEGEPLDLVAAHAYDRAMPFPVLKDFGQRLADQLGVERTPEVVVLDDQFVLRYRGRIDDQYGVAYRRERPGREDLVAALDEILAGKQVTAPETEADGCLIDRGSAVPLRPGITFTKHVAPILERRCQMCHRPGQVAPFSLVTHADATRHAAMIKEVVLQRRMPPWHADARYGKFANDRSMTGKEIDTVVSWIDSGMPRGDNLSSSGAAQWAEGWNIGEPDVVFHMPQEFRVPTDGVLPYKYFVVKTGFEEDRWVQAAEARPGDPAVVHHIIVHVRMPGQRLYRRGGAVSTLVGWAPGDMPLVCPSGTALRIPKGAELVFELHYTPNGVAANDRSSVGIIFAKQPPEREIQVNLFANNRIRVPPNDPHYRAEAAFTLRDNAWIISLLPHMHWRGKHFRYEAIYPDGRTEVLLSVPRWDFNWQSVYRFDEPVRVPKGTRIRAVAHWDNSRNNPYNPDPAAEVRWGLQTWDEMMVGWVTYVWERPGADEQQANAATETAAPP